MKLKIPTEYEASKPRLRALVEAHTEDIKLAASLEKRIAALMEWHATHVGAVYDEYWRKMLNMICQVDALSELFVEWDDAITQAEDKVAKLERDREDRKRMGYE